MKRDATVMQKFTELQLQRWRDGVSSKSFCLLLWTTTDQIPASIPSCSQMPIMPVSYDLMPSFCLHCNAITYIYIYKHKITLKTLSPCDFSSVILFCAWNSIEFSKEAADTGLCAVWHFCVLKHLEPWIKKKIVGLFHKGQKKFPREF